MVTDVEGCLALRESTSLNLAQAQLLGAPGHLPAGANSKLRPATNSKRAGTSAERRCSPAPPGPPHTARPLARPQVAPPPPRRPRPQLRALPRPDPSQAPRPSPARPGPPPATPPARAPPAPPARGGLTSRGQRGEGARCPPAARAHGRSAAARPRRPAAARFWGRALLGGGLPGPGAGRQGSRAGEGKGAREGGGRGEEKGPKPGEGEKGGGGEAEGEERPGVRPPLRPARYVTTSGVVVSASCAARVPASCVRLPGTAGAPSPARALASP